MSRRLRIGMRWWLALALASIAALTALVVAQVFVAKSEASVRERAGELAAGSAVAAATRIAQEQTLPGIRRTTADYGARRRLALFVLDRDGHLLTPGQALGVELDRLPNRDALLTAAVDGRRLVEAIDSGRSVTVAMPIRQPKAWALVAVVSRPDLEETLGIVRQEIVSAALWATGAGALAGVGVALLITRRIRRIGAAATAIEGGRFDVGLAPRFHDEVGDLAEAVERMGRRLAASFSQLESDRDRLGRLLEQLQEGVVAVDRALVVEFANTQARLLTGQDLEPGTPLPDAWPAFPLREQASALFAPGAAPWSERVRPEPGAAFVVGGLPPSADGSSAVLVIVDVTETERRERAEREFVTNAAHELRTPLAAIASAVEVLQSGAQDDPASRERFLSVIARQTTRLGGLVHALLTLARAETRAEPVRLERIELEPLAREVAADAEAAYGVAVTIDAGAGGAALCHRELLHQALSNLVANAATHGEGRGLRLRIYPDQDGRTRIEVADQGPGMPRSDADRIFDRFYRAGDAGGYGLGLSIVSAAVDAMHGEVDVASRPGLGTIVSITLDSGGTGGVT